MFRGITNHSVAFITAIVALTGAAILRGGPAAADAQQDDKFLALLDEEDIPALQNVPSLIETAHRDCRAIDSGIPADALVREKLSEAYSVDPTERRYPVDRLARTMTLFVTAAVEAYCPYDQGKLASITAGSARSNQPAHQAAAYVPRSTDGSVVGTARFRGDRPDSDAQGPALVSLTGAVPAGDLTPSKPPSIPAPSPPAEQIQPPKRAIAAQPRPKQAPPPPKQAPPPPPQQPPPPPQQAPHPAVAPQPGGASGSGGGGNGGGGNGGGGDGSGSGGCCGGRSGGGGPAEHAPEPPMPPGFVRLAP